MSVRPSLIHQFSHFLADELREQGYNDIEIRARVVASLNYRKPQYLIDRTVNLVQEPRTIFPDNWIMSLNEPFPPSTIAEAKDNLGIRISR